MCILGIGMMMQGCNEDVPMVNLGIDDTYFVYRMQKLPLESAFTGKEYRWTLTAPDGAKQVVSTLRNYIFLAETEGEYILDFEIIDDATPYQSQTVITVMHEEIEYSAYISKVYEYNPAPGQFVNTMPQYEEGDTYATMLQKVEESIGGTNEVMISLGAYGGYVTFGFDHTVINHPGEADFRIWGNSFYELTDQEMKGGSAEPGIVMVSYDFNCNGLPDDVWYELRGSEYDNPLTLHDYSITYHRPSDTSTAKNVKWEDSEGDSGVIKANTFHKQGYYPAWVSDETLSFSGARLPNNAVDKNGTGIYYVLMCYDWGYVDNHPNEYVELNCFDISNAVDAYGFPVELPGVDFVRVYTALNQECGWLGETSTELSKAQDLHIKVESGSIPNP